MALSSVTEVEADSQRAKRSDFREAGVRGRRQTLGISPLVDPTLPYPTLPSNYTLTQCALGSYCGGDLGRNLRERESMESERGGIGKGSQAAEQGGKKGRGMSQARGMSRSFLV
eukprot:765489-Hanusia_phi.AAC.6